MRASLIVPSLAAALVLAATSGASAQWNNQPWQPGWKGPSGGVGMSPGYRQAIIQREFTGSEPDNLYRGADGFLLDVRRGPDRQAFLSRPSSITLPYRPSGFLNLGGFGYGGAASGPYLANGGYAGNPYESAQVAYVGWTSLMNTPSDQGSWTGVATSTATPAGQVIDTWIGQLDGL
ncbi:hypothetical protein [Fodinicurvata sediminis]|uniref:hypothetical protein n=1 Tax=Fodinicurvata sediminis TaxID=1121832 RepID=UPI0003B6360E|nr:hypothetical protein [Fodinicurvata sediminis]